MGLWKPAFRKAGRKEPPLSKMVVRQFVTATHPLAPEFRPFCSPLRVPWLGAVRYTGRALEERSEEHTSELQSLRHIVCRLLLEKKTIQPSAPNRIPLRPPTNHPACTALTA